MLLADFYCHSYRQLTDSLLLVVRQASDDRYNNKGAYIVLKAPDFSVPHFFEFEAVHPRPKVQTPPLAFYANNTVVFKQFKFSLKAC